MMRVHKRKTKANSQTLSFFVFRLSAKQPKSCVDTTA